jgi:hypothetical protein
MFLFAAILVSFVPSSSCSEDKNDPILNPECNNAGYCYAADSANDYDDDYADSDPVSECKCCTLDDSKCIEAGWNCDPNNPGWGCIEFEGESCSNVIVRNFINLGFRIESRNKNAPADVFCPSIPSTDPALYKWRAASVDLTPQLQYLVKKGNWPGSIIPAYLCEKCTPAVPCKIGAAKGVNATSGFGVTWSVNFNEFYDASCGNGRFINPRITNVELTIPDCEANFDYGLRASKRWDRLVDNIKLSDLNDLVQKPNTTEFGLGWTNSRAVGYKSDLPILEKQVYIPTPHPTSKPTHQPSQSPTPSPTSPCVPYVNDVEKMEFLGIGANCRAGMNISWPGGLTCDSPYIVCLPEENTPGKFGGKSYESTTHRYSVPECLHECANDQRCLGIEFVADTRSSLGDCILIDDIPIEITSSISGFIYNPANIYPNLDSSETNGNAMCFTKKDCFPYFEAEQLNEVMLDCYCPNNRKGFYTKRVKRTKTNTRLCGDDSEVNLRVQKAQANRMFHLCENWCLFQTEDPKAESWYWDPWKTCWREQYADVDGHMSYCSRVIINPDTIEMQFVNYRSKNFCGAV